MHVLVLGPAVWLCRAVADDALRYMCLVVSFTASACAHEFAVGRAVGESRGTVRAFQWCTRDLLRGIEARACVGASSVAAGPLLLSRVKLCQPWLLRRV